MKGETLSWLASNTRYTKRYERHIGRLCRELTIKRVAELERLSWYQVRQIEINYMHELVGRFGKITRLRTIGIDEISIRKGHTYMIRVSDLDKGRPIWVGEEGRREEDLDLFYTTLSDSQKKNISIVVMDMWKPFRKSTLKHIPHAQIVYDKFHILHHLGDAMDTVRKQEHSRVTEKERIFVKGQKYTLYHTKQI
ncbi:MAG: transposase [Candidatus Jettenia sp.]|nr:transposase [Candidatus Jettenia sp.]